MATDLTTIFGSEINVYAQPRAADRQYAGFPGAHGVVGMFMGTRGSRLVISGTLASSGANYNTARANLQAVIDSIEAYLLALPADYSFKGTTYYNVVFDRFELIPDARNKVFHWTSEGYATCLFICIARVLI